MTGPTLNSGFNLGGPPAIGAGIGRYQIMGAPIQMTVGGLQPLVATWPDPLPTATQGVAYRFTLTATGGVLPYTFSLDAGFALPTGLSLNGATGVISGTPVTAVSLLAESFAVTDSS